MDGYMDAKVNKAFPNNNKMVSFLILYGYKSV